MKRIISILSVLAVSTMLATAADEKPAAGAAKPEAAAGAAKPKPDPEAAWAKLSGGKESVTKEEFTAKAKDKAKSEATFDKKDTNHDGKLTKEEFLAHGKKK